MANERFIATVQASLVKKETRLRALARNAIPEVKKAVEQTTQEIIQELIDNYNTAEPGVSYERTGPNGAGSLGASWETSTLESNGRIVVVILNDAIDDRGRAYSSFVQGESQTARHAAAGWRTIKEVQQEHAHAQSNRVRAAIRRAGDHAI